MATNDEQKPAGTPPAMPPAPEPGNPSNDTEAQAIWDEMAAEELKAGKTSAPAAPVEETFKGDPDAGKPDPTKAPVASPAPSPSPSPSPAPSSAPAATPAPMAGMFSADEIAALRELPNAIKTLGGRVATMQSELAKTGKAAAAATPGADAPTGADIEAASKSLDKWNKMKDDFPEWAEAIEELQNSKTGGGGAVDAEAIRREAREEAAAMIEAARKQDRAEREVDEEISEAHPKWVKTINEPKFVAWFQAQPADYQAKQRVAKTSHEMIEMLDAYKAAHQQSPTSAPTPPSPPTDTAPAADLAAAVTPRGGRAVPKKSVDDLEGEALWNELAKDT